MEELAENGMILGQRKDVHRLIDFGARNELRSSYIAFSPHRGMFAFIDVISIGGWSLL